MSETNAIVEILRHQGAVPFVTTNIPQTMMVWDSGNPIFGYTNSPYSRDRSAGGSSGGEGALIAGGGSLLGWGSDIGGSIRIPCCFNGIYGLKPTAERITMKGVFKLGLGQITSEQLFIMSAP